MSINLLLSNNNYLIKCSGIISKTGVIDNLTVQKINNNPVSGEFVDLNSPQTITNKTINSDNNFITNISNFNIKGLAGIDCSKIHDGSVSNLEFGFLNNVSSNIQNQIDNKISASSIDVLTNKTISGSNNTISNIPDSALSNNIPKLDGNNSFINPISLNTLKFNGTIEGGKLTVRNTSDIILTQWDNFNGILEQFYDINMTSGKNYQINGIALKDVTETLTNKTISGSNNTISNIPSSALPSNIICQSIQNTATGIATFNFKNDSGVNMMYFSNGGLGALTGSNFDFNIPTGFNFMINQVPITETTETLSNKTLDDSCLVQNISLQYPQAKISTNNIRAPINTDDQRAGRNYTQGSIWVDGLSSPHQIYFCTDSTVDNAVWQKMILSTDILTNTINSTNSITTTSNITGSSFITSNLSLNSTNISAVTGNIDMNSSVNITSSNVLRVAGNQVITERQPAVSDATSGADVITQFNTLLSRLRVHGLIFT